MDVGRPSRTAMAVARARADHQSADEPRIFTDPYARAIVGESDPTSGDFDRGLDPGLVRRRRLFIAARSRFADDTVAAAVAAGTRQVVILGAGLAEAGFDHGHAAVFVWLGVVMYLTKPSITGTWRYIADQGGGALLVMDYMYPPSESSQRMRERAARVAASGEPWLSWFTPDEIHGELTAAGLTVVDDYPASAVLNRYLEVKVSVPSDTGAVLAARSVT